jgi:hypothetical protein
MPRHDTPAPSNRLRPAYARIAAARLQAAQARIAAGAPLAQDELTVRMGGR